MYIMTLGVLAAYRNHGIGSKLVTSVLDYFESEKDGKLSNVNEIMLHVQTSNTDAMKFYGEKFGFERGELVENYYKRIDCLIRFSEFIISYLMPFTSNLIL